jgi:2'-5' RNA ligase
MNRHKRSTEEYKKELNQMNSDHTLSKAAPDYKTQASSGVIAYYPVSFRGKKLSDEGVPFHMTVKFFGHKDSLDLNDVKQRVEKHRALLSQPVDEKDIMAIPHKFKTQTGITHHVLLLHGVPDHVKQVYENNKDIGATYKSFAPHITVSEEIYNQLNGKPARATDLGIKFHPAEFKVGDQVHKTF